MSKNIADKRMKHKIEEPSILLLKDSVGVGSERNDRNDRNEARLLTDMQSLIDQEDHWIDIIKKKLT